MNVGPYVITADIIWDCIKIVAQVVAALVVARVAVPWALTRFKREKVWERGLAAQADILVALAEMRRVYGQWADELERYAADSKEKTKTQQQRLAIASRKLEEAMPLAQFLLSQETTRILIKLEIDREKLEFVDEWSHYNDHYSLLDDAIADIVHQARKLLP